MILAFGDRESLANTNNIADEASAKRYRARVRRFTLLWRNAPLIQASPERLIDHILETFVLGLAQTLQGRGDVIVDRQGRSHAS
jgi:hypothetical protein